MSRIGLATSGGPHPEDIVDLVVLAEAVISDGSGFMAAA